MMITPRRLSTRYANRQGKGQASLTSGRFLPRELTGKAADSRACPDLIPHSIRSVKTLDIHSLHSAYCYRLRVISIKRKSYYGGQLSLTPKPSKLRSR